MNYNDKELLRMFEWDSSESESLHASCLLNYNVLNWPEQLRKLSLHMLKKLKATSIIPVTLVACGRNHQCPVWMTYRPVTLASAIMKCFTRLHDHDHEPYHICTSKLPLPTPVCLPSQLVNGWCHIHCTSRFTDPPGKKETFISGCCLSILAQHLITPSPAPPIDYTEQSRTPGQHAQPTSLHTIDSWLHSRAQFKSSH